MSWNSPPPTCGPEIARYFNDRLFPDQRDQGAFVEFRPGVCAPLN